MVGKISSRPTCKYTVEEEIKIKIKQKKGKEKQVRIL